MGISNVAIKTHTHTDIFKIVTSVQYTEQVTAE